MVEDVTVIVAVASEQVGGTILNVGASGVDGCAFTVFVASPDTHPAAF